MCIWFGCTCFIQIYSYNNNSSLSENFLEKLKVTKYVSATKCLSNCLHIDNHQVMYAATGQPYLHFHKLVDYTTCYWGEPGVLIIEQHCTAILIPPSTSCPFICCTVTIGPWVIFSISSCELHTINHVIVY